MFSPGTSSPSRATPGRWGCNRPTGAAIRDIMNISARRNPYVQLYLYPALVQGENAKYSIVKESRRWTAWDWMF